MRISIIILGLALVSGLLSGSARGDLIGSAVSGELVTSIGAPPIGNLFDPSNNTAKAGVPAAGFLNSSGPNVTISATQVEFGYDDDAHSVTADFGATTLRITDIQTISAIPLKFFFYDPAFSGLNFVVSNDTFPEGGTSIEHTFSPSRISIYAPDPGGAGGSYSAVYTLLPVPEPSSFALMGAAAIILARRHRGQSRNLKFAAHVG